MSSNSIPISLKTPNEILDYGFNWEDTTIGPWLAAGDTVLTSLWTVPTGIIKLTDSFTPTITTVWLSGGTAGVDYDIVNKITTAQGRTAERTFIARLVANR